jgi:hypothetical protein
MVSSITLEFDRSPLADMKYFGSLLVNPPPFEAPSLRNDVRTIAQRAWIDRTRSEYIGVMIARRLWGFMVDVNAPSDVQELALKMILDEQRHTALCMAAARALGADAEVIFDLDELQQSRSEDPINEQLLEMVVGTYAVGEVTALALVTHACREVPPSGFREVLRMIAADEVLHGRIGIALLEAAKAGKTAAWMPWTGDEDIAHRAQTTIDAMRIRDVVEPDEAALFEDPEAAAQLKALAIPESQGFKARYLEALSNEVVAGFESIGVTLGETDSQT